MLYDRQKYVEALKAQVEPNIFNHSLAVEACMAGICDYLKETSNKEDWLLAGLMHDIDYSLKYKSFHPNKTKEALSECGLEVSDNVYSIIQAHAPEITQVKPCSKAQWAIFCADSLTGLIVASALVLPSKKLADVKVSSVLKRFLKDPKFAAGTRREEIAMCQNLEGLNIPLEKFIEICLVSMQGIASEIGL